MSNQGAMLLQSISSGGSLQESFSKPPNFGVPSEPNDPEFDTIFTEREDMQSGTQLHNRYVFYCLKRNKGAQAQAAAQQAAIAQGLTAPAVVANYEEGIKRIASFQTVEYFWYIYDHIIRTNDQKGIVDFHLFKNGIKPTWEDPNNENGGKWMVRLKKGLSSLYWEDLILAIIGEQFDVGNEICGAVVSVRGTEDIISIWNKTASNVEATDKIRDHMRRIFKLPTFVPMEYKKHIDSRVDKSSFRNTQVWRAPAGGRGDKRGDGQFGKSTYRKQGESFPAQYQRGSNPPGSPTKQAWGSPRAGPDASSATGTSQFDQFGSIPSTAPWASREEGAAGVAPTWQRVRGSSDENSASRSMGDGVSRPSPTGSQPAAYPLGSSKKADSAWSRVTRDSS